MTASTPSDKRTSCVAARIHLTGRVQGIGLRPAVVRFAQELGLLGYVQNTHHGVEIHVAGTAPDVRRFEQELTSHLPAAAELSSVEVAFAEPGGFDTFVVRHPSCVPAPDSDEGNSPVQPLLSARVPPDVAVCDQCLAELRCQADRRHDYAFISCTDCGPRYSIVRQMPFEREQTSMAEFPLCDRCRSEYESARDRRFHAQTNACPNCGPQIWLRDGRDHVFTRGADAVHAAARALLDGRIVALRGLGGYQVIVDATSQDAVERLRQRKRRRGKPLAVMVASLTEAAKLSWLDETERRALSSPAGPIVVAVTRGDARLAPSVTAGLNSVGLMLPTTPLHGLLLDRAQRPLVCTSGNVEGDPLEYEAASALERLGGIADVWLEHNRPIWRPIDDSVVRVVAGRPATIRLARGYAPLPLNLETEGPMVALGGHQKSSMALTNGEQAVLGPHVGDLDSVASRGRFVDQAFELSELFGAKECPLVVDCHPDYFTTGWAENQTDCIVQVQHHHAHVVAGMLEHGWLDRRVLGVSFDGTGYGSDGTIWGGEFLLATATNFTRVGHLRPFLLPGGERAVREPWRVATALVRESAGDAEAARLDFQMGHVETLLSVLQRRHLSPVTTSAGRLFDAIAALVLGVERSQFEGQAAMLLESACDFSATGRYEIFVENRKPVQLDWRPLVRQILRDRASGASPGAIAMRFHRGLADAVFELCRRHTSLPVVLGGGVFQNRILVELLAERFANTDQPLGLPGLIPPNDGGLAAGQLAVAASLAHQRRSPACV